MRTPEQWNGLERLENFEAMLENFCAERDLYGEACQDIESRSLRVEVRDEDHTLVMYIPLDDIRYYPYTHVFNERVRRAWEGVKRG